MKAQTRGGSIPTPESWDPDLLVTDPDPEGDPDSSEDPRSFMNPETFRMDP